MDIFGTWVQKDPAEPNKQSRDEHNYWHYKSSKDDVKDVYVACGGTLCGVNALWRHCWQRQLKSILEQWFSNGVLKYPLNLLGSIFINSGSKAS